MARVRGYERLHRKIAKPLRKHRTLYRFDRPARGEAIMDGRPDAQNISGQGHITQPTRPICDKGASVSPKTMADGSPKAQI